MLFILTLKKYKLRKMMWNMVEREALLGLLDHLPDESLFLPLIITGRQWLFNC